MRQLCALAALTVALVGPVVASDPKALDPDVAFVLTTGYWQLGDGSQSSHGQYRLVVTNSGWEHVSSKVQLQWLIEDPTTRTVRVYAAADVKELSGGLLSVEEPTYNYRRGEFEIKAASSVTPTSKGEHYRLKPSGPGKYVLEKA